MVQRLLPSVDNTMLTGYKADTIFAFSKYENIGEPQSALLGLAIKIRFL